MRTKLSKDYRQLEMLGDWIRQFASQCGLSKETSFSLDLVLTEAVTNVMDHARGASAEGEIELVCSLHDGYIAIGVLDDGPPFDPTAHAQAPLPRTLEDVRPGGLGIHLMREYTSYMHYRREHDRNILCMTLPIQPAPPSD